MFDIHAPPPKLDFESAQTARLHGERDVTWPCGSVRGHRATRDGYAVRVEYQENRAVLEPERRPAVVRLLEQGQPERLGVELRRGGYVRRVENRFIDAQEPRVGRIHDAEDPSSAPSLTTAPRTALAPLDDQQGAHRREESGSERQADRLAPGNPRHDDGPDHVSGQQERCGPEGDT